MTTRSRRYLQCKEVTEPRRDHSLEEAIELLKKAPPLRFDETVELAVKLGIDARQSDQRVRGSFTLPHGTGKAPRVVVFAEGSNAKEAEEAGADHVGAAELAEKVKGGWLEFDVALATPDMMRIISQLGRVLGPRGLMPSPKSETVREDIADAVKEFKAGRVEFRNDKGGNVHVPVGKLSFATQSLVENVQASLEHLLTLKPAAAKGRYIQKVVVSTTMGLGLRISL